MHVGRNADKLQVYAGTLAAPHEVQGLLSANVSHVIGVGGGGGGCAWLKGRVLHGVGYRGKANNTDGMRGLHIALTFSVFR